MNRRNTNSLYAALICLQLAGCGRAPAVDIQGSFFPIWMICLTTGMVLTFALRFLLVRVKLESYVGPVALFYPCLIVLLTGLIWLTFYR